MTQLFDAKHFNEEVFKYLRDRVPNLNANELRKSRALVNNGDFQAMFNAQNGSEYAKVAMRGLAGDAYVNYDGKTDIAAQSTKTFERGVVVIGRANAWTEKDFAYDVTAGVDPMQNVAEQVNDWAYDVDQADLLAELKGIFSMTGTKNLEFVDKHTYTIDTGFDATTLNKAMNKACGANKGKFSLVIMHSDKATEIENLHLMEYLKYTDADGIQRTLSIGNWSGRTVLVDDGMPVEDNGGVLTYTTYVLGDGAFDYADVGAKVPHEMARDPKTNGGQDTLYVRQRKIFAPKGISYTKKAQASLSPTREELANGANWELVHSGEASEESRTYINHKSINIARIISK